MASFSPQGSFLVYQIDSDDEDDVKCHITKGIPQNSPVKVLVRIYVVKVTNKQNAFMC